MMVKKIVLLIAILFLFFMGCIPKEHEIQVAVIVDEESEKDILSFSINGVVGSMDGDKINLIVEKGVDLTKLTPIIAINGVSVIPGSGEEQDFTENVSYKVTAENGSTKFYMVDVKTALDSEKEISSFKIGEINGIIIENEINLIVAKGTNLGNLIPIIEIVGVELYPASGVAQDFNLPINYIVTAEDGTYRAYTVVVREELGIEKEILLFKIEGKEAIIDGRNITLNLDYGTDLSSLVPIIEINGMSVTPSSGEEQDFTEAVEYTVTAEDGSKTTYNVEIIVEREVKTVKMIISDLVILGLASGEVVFTNILSSEEEESIKLFDGEVVKIVIDEGKEIGVALSFNKEITVFDIKNRIILKKFSTEAENISDMEISSSGKYLMIETVVGDYYFYNVLSGDELLKISGKNSVAFSSYDGNCMVAEMGKVEMVEIETGNLVTSKVFNGTSEDVKNIAISSNYVVGIFGWNSIQIWNPDGIYENQLIVSTGKVKIGGSEVLFTQKNDNDIYIYNLASKEEGLIPFDKSANLYMMESGAIIARTESKILISKDLSDFEVMAEALLSEVIDVSNDYIVYKESGVIYSLKVSDFTKKIVGE